jgi:tellurite resistance protein TerC
LLVLDLGVLNRQSHRLTPREAVLWCAGLISLALVFGAVVWRAEGPGKALEYYTGYLIELSLSVDNLFVFILIFQYFAVPPALQARVLKWGIIGAIAMRGAMIALGALLLQQFHWIVYVFGGILIATGYRMLMGRMERIQPEHNPVVRLARRMLRLTPAYEGQHFFVRTHAGWYATPLLLVVLIVEWTDLVFAIDSIPAIFAVTRDPFIVYSSNVFAILGLRAMFFVLAGAVDRFVYLKPTVALVLVFVGGKMLLETVVTIPTTISLGVVVALLTTGALASLRRPRSR